MKNSKTMNIAHRGARSIAPENTILAAQKALEIGADMWELDVAMTADGEIVVLHDDTLERTSNVASVFPDRQPWKIESFTMGELKSLDFGSWFIKADPFGQIASGVVTKEDQQSFINLPIPTLQNALIFTRDLRWRVNVEIKDLTGAPGNKDIVEKVVKQISGLGMEDSVIISSFNHSYIQRAKSDLSNITTAALVEVPDPDPIALLTRLNAQAYNPNLDTLEISQIEEVTSKGFSVYIWTVNDAATMGKLINAGVSGLLTDFPHLLKKVIHSQ